MMLFMLGVAATVVVIYVAAAFLLEKPQKNSLHMGPGFDPKQ